jgi:nucleotide-binding universal stress UspA family protein
VSAAEERPMFKHILIPTDGSPLAAKGAKAGIRLAAALGARVTGVYVIGPYLPPVYAEASVMVTPGVTPQEYDKAAKAHGAKALGLIEREAKAARVPCKAELVTEVHPWQGILKVARARKCDAIAMASHGRGAIRGLILGSETARVLAHSKIPVLVTR